MRRAVWDANRGRDKCQISAKSVVNVRARLSLLAYSANTGRIGILDEWVVFCNRLLLREGRRRYWITDIEDGLC